jgi:pimeloyl-ACP methyl ester carboxylesterase
MKSIIATAALLLAGSLTHADEAKSVAIEHKFVEVEGLRIFYREAGPRAAPVILLLHGFPSSSFMFRNLMPLLAGRYRIIAPDYPGFGQSTFADPNKYTYSFEHLAMTMEKFVESQGINRYAMYIQDYGAPIGLRMALRHPERLTALIVQNGNAYAEGLSAGWDPLKSYWQEPTPENRAKLRGWLTAEGIREQYVAGVPMQSVSLFSPDTWTLDWALLQRPGNIDVQLDLFGDYRHNVELYPRFQQMFRERRVSTLIVWGKHDPFFTEAGARGYLKDLPDAELHWLDTGHFALETHYQHIAKLMNDFLARRVAK